MTAPFLTSRLWAKDRGPCNVGSPTFPSFQDRGYGAYLSSMSSLTRAELEALDRDALVAQADAAGVAGARRLTKPELVDELLKRDGSPEAKKARGLLGMARDLLSRVIERGLHLPDAAERFRAARPPASARSGPSRSPEAVPTVTLAEIYAAQGHRDKAVRTLEQVLSSDPENPTAVSLLARLKDASVPLPPPITPEPEEEPLGSSSSSTASTTEEIQKVEEPASMLDGSEPLPPRYDVDECVAMPVDPTTVYVYWEIREETLALARKDAKDGSVALRVLVIVPSWDGPKVASHDIDVHSAVGDWFLRELPEGAVVRVAVGWRSNEAGFVPAAHTYAVEPTPETRSPIVADLLVRWTPWGIVPASGQDPKALEIARAMALQEVRRHAIGAMAREAAAALGLRPEGAPSGSSERWQRPLGSSELHPAL